MHALDILGRLGDLNGGLVRRQDAIAAGVAGKVLTQLTRSGSIARVARGIYLVGRTAHLPPWTAAMSLRGVISYVSAAAWWGVDLPRPADLTHVTTSRNRGRRRDAVDGVRIHRADLRPGERCVVAGVWVTSPMRTVLDIARHASLEDAVAVIDGFLRNGLVALPDVRRELFAAVGPGRSRMQLVARLVDDRSGSILESLTRVLLWRRGLLPPAAQYVVKDRAATGPPASTSPGPNCELRLSATATSGTRARRPSSPTGVAGARSFGLTGTAAS